MSSDILQAIKSDNVEALRELEEQWGQKFFRECQYSIQFAIWQGSFDAASYLISVSTFKHPKKLITIIYQSSRIVRIVSIIYTCAP